MDNTRGSQAQDLVRHCSLVIGLLTYNQPLLPPFLSVFPLVPDTSPPLPFPIFYLFSKHAIIWLISTIIKTRHSKFYRTSQVPSKTQNFPYSHSIYDNLILLVLTSDKALAVRLQGYASAGPSVAYQPAT